MTDKFDSGADIDTLLVAPRHIDRVDFFSTFFEVLQNHPNVTDLRVITNLYSLQFTRLYFFVSFSLQYLILK